MLFVVQVQVHDSHDSLHTGGCLATQICDIVEVGVARLPDLCVVCCCKTMFLRLLHGRLLNLRGKWRALERSPSRSIEPSAVNEQLLADDNKRPPCFQVPINPPPCTTYQSVTISGDAKIILPNPRSLIPPSTSSLHFVHNQ
jgi:hypothetical protein